jgi:mRNA-degrading endonuclease RelE of RelBE toxin-antitoxin system
VRAKKLHCQTVAIVSRTRKADTTKRVEYAKLFLRKLRKKRIADSDLDSLTNKLQANPEVGAIVPGAGGARKKEVHWRGGSRVIYYYHAPEGVVWGITFYLKSEKSDLTPEEKIAIKAIIKERFRM